MTLRLKLLLYLLAIHLLFLGVGTYLLWSDHKPYILLLEVVTVLSFILGLQIIKGFGLHLDIISSGADFIREGDFIHTFSEVSSKDINQLVQIYNEMITRLRNEKILQQEQQLFLEKVLEASPSGVLSLDLDGCIRMYNPAVLELLELKPAEIKGKKINELNSSLGNKLESLSIGSTQVLSIGHRKKLRCSHLQYRESGFLCSFFLLEELTRELWESEKSAYETLIRTLSHEVNNTVGATNSILRSCLTYGKQLKDEDREDFEEALNVAIERTDLLNRFMASYADVIRLPEPHKTQIDLTEVLKSIESLLRPEVKERRITISLLVDAGSWKVYLDRVQMEQALVNIIRNSIEAIGENGRINLRLIREDNSRQLVVEDNGCGLDPDTNESIFTPFFSTKENGQGIGLTLTREILTKHNMAFSLVTCEDKKTRFTIQLSH